MSFALFNSAFSFSSSMLRLRSSSSLSSDFLHCSLCSCPSSSPLMCSMVSLIVPPPSLSLFHLIVLRLRSRILCCTSFPFFPFFFYFCSIRFWDFCNCTFSISLQFFYLYFQYRIQKHLKFSLFFNKTQTVFHKYV